MLKWTVAGQRAGGTATWRQTDVVNESPTCFLDKQRRRRPTRMSGKHDKENSSCAVSLAIKRQSNDTEKTINKYFFPSPTFIILPLTGYTDFGNIFHSIHFRSLSH